MNDFRISFSELNPNSRKEIRAYAENWAQELDFFTALSYFVEGRIRIENDEKFIEFPIMGILSFFVNLMSRSFLGNFSQEVEGIGDQRDAQPNSKDHNSGGTVVWSLATRGHDMILNISFLGEADFVSNLDLQESKTISFTVPLLVFNQAVGKVYDQILDVFEDIVSGIDGFEDRFCLIPFRGEMRDY